MIILIITVSAGFMATVELLMLVMATAAASKKVFVYYDTNVPCQHLHQKPLQPPSPPHSIEILQQLEEGSVPRAEPEHVACLCCLPVYLRAVRETAP